MRLSSLMMSLLLGACTISSTGEEPASVECTTGADGELICTQTGQGEEDQPGDNEGDPTNPDGENACSSEECVIHCEEGGTNEDGSESQVVHCVIECANGLRCDQVCNGESCTMSCTCPDQGGGEDPGCNDDSTAEGCQDPHPCDDDSTAEGCQDPQPCDDNNTEGCQDPGEEDYCDLHPDSEECQEGGTDPGGCENADDPDCCNHPDDESHEEYCQEHPDSPEC